jgi:hypothetical protein
MIKEEDEEEEQVLPLPSLIKSEKKMTLVLDDNHLKPSSI